MLIYINLLDTTLSFNSQLHFSVDVSLPLLIHALFMAVRKEEHHLLYNL